LIRENAILQGPFDFAWLAKLRRRLSFGLSQDGVWIARRQCERQQRRGKGASNPKGASHEACYRMPASASYESWIARSSVNGWGLCLFVRAVPSNYTNIRNIMHSWAV